MITRLGGLWVPLSTALICLACGGSEKGDDDDAAGGHAPGGQAGVAGHAGAGASAGAGAGGVGGTSGVGGAGGSAGANGGTGGAASGNGGTGGSAGVSGSAATSGGAGGAAGSAAAGGNGAIGGAGAAGAAGGSGMAGAGGMIDPATHFTIKFDYSFDSRGMFDDPERRRLLEYAGEVWASHIADEFEDIPAGTEILVRNPEDYETSGSVFTVDYTIDDLVVFAGFAEHDGAAGTLASARSSAAIGSVSDPDLVPKLDTRYNGSKFEPWTGWVSFDVAEPYFYDPTPETADDIPADQMDFLTVAYHELGHILGVGASDAFDSLVDGETFIGTHAVAAYGGPVPLAPGGTSHFYDGIMSDGRRMTMDSSDPSGQRFPPTTLDLAVLADLGYVLRQ